MKRNKIAILTDLDPKSNPGANLVAYKYAEAALKDFEVELWTSSCVDSKNMENRITNEIRTRVFSSRKFFYEFPRRGVWAKTLRELFSPLPLLWIVWQIVKFRPALIWVNQIGNIFPISVFVVCRTLRIPALFTLHDFGVLVPRKLYPADLNLCNDDLNNLAYNHISPEKLNLKNSSLSQFYLLRFFVIKMILKSVHLVSVSKLQHKILTANKLMLLANIENGVEPCDCGIDINPRLEAVLFAGRLNGKGLSHAIDIVNQNSNLTLHLAGGIELAEAASKKLASDRIIHHGEISQAQLGHIMHCIKFTSVLSDCFDVYPSILLEALVHGSAPLCYPTVGNATLVSRLDQSLLIDFGHILEREELSRLNLDSELSLKAFKIGKTLNTVDDAYGEYYRLIQQITKMAEK